MRVFAYGLLQLDDIVEAVCGRSFVSMPATLGDYARFAVSGEEFPGIVERRGASTPGRVLLDVDAEALRRLDAFEGAMYERRVVTVCADARRLSASAYIVAPAHRHRLSGEPWSLERYTVARSTASATSAGPISVKQRR